MSNFKFNKKHFKRRLNRQQRQFEDMSLQAEQSIERHVYKRFDRLMPVRNFVIGWVGLVVLLIAAVVAQNIGLSSYYQTLTPTPGGIFIEGSQGIYSNANPIYATTDPDNTISSLIFAGLFKNGPDGSLLPNLASSYSVDTTGKVYTVHLKPNLTWQDGVPLTSKDVAFTINTIENPDADSPLFSSWSGVSVTTPNPMTVVFKLPDVLASFPYELTVGIIPQHILGNIPVSSLSSNDFNSIHPVGAGPFAWQSIVVNNASDPDNQEIQITLKPFANYNGGAPKIDQFIEQVYASQDQLVNDFKSKNITAMEAVTPPPDSVQAAKNVYKTNFLLRAENMVFFKTTAGVLADQQVRNALVDGANVPAIIAKLGYSTVPVVEPLLKGQLGYNPSYAQSNYDPTVANQILQKDGWALNSKGLRFKQNQTLTFTITAADTVENQQVTQALINQWKKIGASVNVQLMQPNDFSQAVSTHDYDSILTSISIGKDPDVFVYWDSSQADIRSAYRLNLSEFSNSTADLALEGGRTRLLPALRVAKYQPFLAAWQQQSPSLGLYQPRLLYLSHVPINNLDISTLTNASDRFYNVQNWEVKEAKTTD